MSRGLYADDDALEERRKRASELGLGRDYNEKRTKMLDVFQNGTERKFRLTGGYCLLAKHGSKFIRLDPGNPCLDRYRTYDEN